MKAMDWKWAGCLALVLGFGLSADAQEGKRKKPDGPRPDRAQVLEKYDQDGDGELSEAELEKLKADRLAAQEERWQEGTRREAMLERFDKDGDGELSEEERAAMREEVGERGPGRRGSREAMLKRFDKDGDGELSEEERAAMREALGDRGPGRRGNREAMLKRFDKDGDGELSEEERQAAREAMQKRRRAAPQPE